MSTLVAAVFVASLAGSPHCVAMCGGFACVAGAQGRGFGVASAYHLGRLLVYVVLGALAGAAGAGIERAGHAAGLPRAAAFVAGGLMVLWGLVQLARAAGLRVGEPGTARLHRVLAPAMRAANAWPPAPRALAIGGLSGLLPCGWLHAFVATAAGTGSPLLGALAMAAFWLGTVPALAATAFLARRALGPIGRRLPIVAAGVVLVLGLLTIAGRFQPLAAMAGLPGGACEYCAPGH